MQTFRIDIPETMVKDPMDVTRLQEEIAHKLEAIPGVSSVGFSRNIPMDDSAMDGADHDRGPCLCSRRNPPRARYGFLAPGFLKTLGIPLVAGREYTWNDIYNSLR